MSRSAFQLSAVLSVVDLDCPLVRMELIQALSRSAMRRAARRAGFAADLQQRSREACEGLAALAERASETCLH